MCGRYYSPGRTKTDTETVFRSMCGAKTGRAFPPRQAGAAEDTRLCHGGSRPGCLVVSTQNSLICAWWAFTGGWVYQGKAESSQAMGNIELKQLRYRQKG